MAAGSVCTVCGNEVDPALARCPFCKQERKPEYAMERSEQFRVVNLERGMPLVDDALKHLRSEFETAKHTGCRVLVLIHGYGSSGKGGAIKDAVRSRLKIWVDQETVKEVLPGEECGKRHGHARQLLKRFPYLKEYVLRPNPGISLVVL